MSVLILTLGFYKHQRLSDRLQVSCLEMLRNVSLAFGVSADCTGSLFCNIGTLRALFCLDHCPNTGPTIDNEGDDACAESLLPVIHRCCIFPAVNPFCADSFSRLLHHTFTKFQALYDPSLLFTPCMAGSTKQEKVRNYTTVGEI